MSKILSSGLIQVKKEMLLDPDDLRQFQNHSSQMAALDFMVSVASSVFIPTYDGNMAKLVEGHRRYFSLNSLIREFILPLFPNYKTNNCLYIKYKGKKSWEPD